MVLTKKTSQQISAAAKGLSTKKGVENLPRKSREPVNDWAILDEIEAPMWADLTLECNPTYESKDDEWFHVSHLFHQCSARKLMSSFSYSVEHCMNSAFEVQGPSSPQLPPSVSKSRGQDYKSRRQEPVVCSLTINKKHLVKSSSNKSLFINAGSEKAIKNNAFDGKVKGHLKYKSDSVGDSTSTEAIAHVFSESLSSFSDENTSAKPVAFGGGESNSTSTITSEVTAGKLIGASSQPFRPTNGLLSNLRDSLRKSYVTRQAARGEIKAVSQFEGRKSSSSKSSVGSSSHPGCDGINLTIAENVEKTPDSRNIMSVSQLPTNKLTQANVHEVPAAQAQNTSCKSNFGINRDASKTMDHKKNREGHVTRKVNKCIPPATAKNSTRARGIHPSTRTVNGGKENQSGKMVLGIKPSMKLKEAEGCLHDPKIVRRKAHQKNDTTKLVGLRENCSSGSKVKKSIRMVETVYFR